MSDTADRYWNTEEQRWIYPDEIKPDDWRIPVEDIPIGWRVSHCIMTPITNEWWVMLEGPPKPWPIRTVGAWGPTLREATLLACKEARL